MDLGGWLRSLGLEQTPTMSDWSAGEATKSMTTIGHVFIPLDRQHDGMVPTEDDQAHFESLPVRSRYGSRSSNDFPSTCRS